MKTLKVIIPALVSVISLIIAIIIAVSPSPADESVDTLTTHLHTAQQYLIDLDYYKAITEFEAVIQIDPMNVDAYIGLAQAYIGNGESLKAIATLEKGYDITYDERLQSLLAGFVPIEETSVTKNETTISTNTEITTSFVSEPTQINTDNTIDTNFISTSTSKTEVQSTLDIEDKFSNFLVDRAFREYKQDYLFIPYEKMNLYYGAKSDYYNNEYIPSINDYFQGIFSTSVEQINKKEYLLTIGFFKNEDGSSNINFSMYDSSLIRLYNYDIDISELLLLTVNCGRSDDHLIVEIAWNVGAYTSSTYGQSTYLFDLNNIAQKKSATGYVITSSHHMGGAYSLWGKSLTSDSNVKSFFETSNGDVTDSAVSSAEKSLSSYLKNIDFNSYTVKVYEEGPSFEANIDKYLCITDYNDNIVIDKSGMTEFLKGSFAGNMVDANTGNYLEKKGTLYLFRPENYNGSVINSKYEYIFDTENEYPGSFSGKVKLGTYTLVVQSDGYEDYVYKDFQPNIVRASMYGDPPIYEFPMKRK